MRTIVAIATMLVGGVLLSTPAQAQQMKKGTLTGKVVSAAVELPANSSATVFTTPTKGFFVLTQVCVDKKDANVRGATVGPVFNDDKCTTYTPGIAFPQSEVITCVNNGGDPAGCCITGVISKK